VYFILKKPNNTFNILYCIKYVSLNIDLDLDTHKIGHKRCNMLSILNQLTLQKDYILYVHSTVCMIYIHIHSTWPMFFNKKNEFRKSAFSMLCVNSFFFLNVCCVLLCCYVCFMYRPFCHCALKRDMSTLFTTFFL